jgi:hypothetical protein
MRVVRESGCVGDEAGSALGAGLGQEPLDVRSCPGRELRTQFLGLGAFGIDVIQSSLPLLHQADIGQLQARMLT